jgi:hypothetical protein
MPRILGILAACAVLVMSALPAVAQSVEKAPPGGAYKKVSELVKLPDFLPNRHTLCRSQDPSRGTVPCL